MRKLTKLDFMIFLVGEQQYLIFYRERFLYFFHRWFPVTYLHLGEDIPMEFKTFQEAIDFVEAVTS